MTNKGIVKENSAAMVIKTLEIGDFKTIRKLQIILKISERCNLTCEYCYYFYGGDQSFKDKPKVLDLSIMDDLVDFITRGISDFSINHVDISFHGGEPLLMKKTKFTQICETLENGLGNLVNLKFTVQTNGTLIDEEWLDIFEKFGVAIGVSVDGLELAHDKYRKDIRGNPTFEKILAAIRLIQQRHRMSLGIGMGLISVINEDFEARDFFRLFYEDLGVKVFSFLLPDCDNDSGTPDWLNTKTLSGILNGIFDEYVRYDNQISIRFIDELLDHFQVKKHSARSQCLGKRNQILVVRSDGQVAIDDTFMPSTNWYQNQEVHYVSSSNLNRFLSQPMIFKLDQAEDTIPKECMGCKWHTVCRGGALENRYKTGQGFELKSVYCETLYEHYSYVEKYLINNGYPVSRMQRCLKS